MTTPMDLESNDPRDPATPKEVRTSLAELFELQARLRQLSEKTKDDGHASSVAITRQRSDAETLSEWLRRLEAGLREARNHVDTLGVALDRIKIVALNTGLEGARLGDLAGKALISVSDELRSLTSRGLELLAEQASTVEQIEVDRQRVVAISERGTSQLSELDTRVRDIIATEQTVQKTLARFAEVLEAATGFDVEAAQKLSRISEQARGLTESLASLSKPEQQRAVRAALLPALEPLLAWLEGPLDTRP